MLVGHRVVWLGTTLLAVLTVLSAASASAAQTRQPANLHDDSSLSSSGPSHVLSTAQLHTEPAHWVEPPAAQHAFGPAKSTNWSGQLVTGTTFSAVSGDWTVPPVEPTTTLEESGTWIGVDGGTPASSSSILQTGTAQLTEDGLTAYYAWYEQYPRAPVTLGSVSPGDHMVASVSYNTATTWKLSIKDVTSGITFFSGSLAYNGPGDSAEWIEELPTASSGPQPYLTNFGSVEFTHVNDTAAHPASALMTPIEMVDGVGNVISRTGSLSNGSFSIAYVPEQTSTSVSASPATSIGGTPVTYSAAVSSAGPPPTGTVTFSDGSITLCTADVAGGFGSCSATNTPQGSDTVDGRYSGDANSTGSSATTQVSVSSSQHGYWLVGSDGGIFAFGSAQFHGSTGNLALQRPVVGITPARDRGGYWLDASDGGIFAFGDAGFFGSMPGLGFNPAGSGLPHSLDAPIVGMVPSVDGEGYFMVASDGGVFAFGDARFAGSCPGIGECAGAAVAVMPDASGNGYWLVTQTGNVYAFGDAPFYGSPGQQSVPVTSAMRTPDGRGYWILFANGAIAYYGDAGEFGMPVGQMGGSSPATAIFSTADGGGYWVAAANGAVANYGDAPNDGSMLGTQLNGAIIAGTGW